jgi:hypothetical protein
VDLTAAAAVASPPAVVFAALQDLGTYPRWLAIVGGATPVAAVGEEGGPAWLVDLVGRVGPFTKRKRVRMVRTGHDPQGGTVRYERREHDGRSHNAWILTAAASPLPAAAHGTDVHVHLHYSGGRSLPGVDLLLRQETRRAGELLQAYLDTLE